MVDNLSLFLIDCKIICIGARKLIYKPADKAEDQQKAKIKANNEIYRKSEQSFKFTISYNKNIFLTASDTDNKISLYKEFGGLVKKREEVFENEYIPKPRLF